MERMPKVKVFVGVWIEKCIYDMESIADMSQIDGEQKDQKLKAFHILE